MKQLTRGEKIERGAAAERILADSAVREAFDDIYDRLHDAFDNLPSNDTKAMTDINCQLRALRQIRSQLDQYRQEGQRERLLDEREPKQQQHWERKNVKP